MHLSIIAMFRMVNSRKHFPNIYFLLPLILKERLIYSNRTVSSFRSCYNMAVTSSMK